MSIKLDGFDELERRLSELEKNVEELSDEQSVPLKELISDKFLLDNTVFKSFDDFSNQDIFKKYETFEEIPQEELDDFISSHSNFSSFNDLLENASVEYMSRRLGF